MPMEWRKPRVWIDWFGTLTNTGYERGGYLPTTFCDYTDAVWQAGVGYGGRLHKSVALPVPWAEGQVDITIEDGTFDERNDQSFLWTGEQNLAYQPHYALVWRDDLPEEPVGGFPYESEGILDATAGDWDAHPVPSQFVFADRRIYLKTDDKDAVTIDYGVHYDSGKLRFTFLTEAETDADNLPNFRLGVTVGGVSSAFLIANGTFVDPAQTRTDSVHGTLNQYEINWDAPMLGAVAGQKLTYTIVIDDSTVDLDYQRPTFWEGLIYPPEIKVTPKRTLANFRLYSKNEPLYQSEMEVYQNINTDTDHLWRNLNRAAGGRQLVDISRVPRGPFNPFPMGPYRGTWSIRDYLAYSLLMIDSFGVENNVGDIIALPLQAALIEQVDLTSDLIVTEIDTVQRIESAVNRICAPYVVGSAGGYNSPDPNAVAATGRIIAQSGFRIAASSS